VTRVERVVDASDEVVAAVERLLPQLSAGRAAPGRRELDELLAATGASLLVARDDDDAIVGMLALLVYRIPSGLMARIDDVVVDGDARGQGIGEALTREAQRLAVDAGAREVGLTSRPERDAANRLYRRLGFEQRETNVYVWRPG
jgi:ribosomal protein S18 acetylase RimI-like enzyme